MKRLRFIFAFLMCSWWVNAQEKPLHFTNYGVKNGLPAAFITDICQDRFGFIWIGTNNGLSKFDGSVFTNFCYDPSNENSLSGNRIFKVMEDSKGNLWIGSNHGLDRFIQNSQTFHRYTHLTDGYHLSSGSFVYDVFEDSKQRLWVGSGEGLFLFDAEKDSFKRYPLMQKGISPELTNCISSVREDQQGNIWVVPQCEGIYRLLPETGSFVHLTLEGKFFKKSINQNSKQIFIGEDNTFWLATRGNGFFRYIPSTGETTWFYSTSEETGLNNNIIYDFLEMPNDELWLGTDGGGINILDKKTDTFRYIKSNNSVSNGLRSNATEVFLKDRQNNLWIGTVTGGLYIYNDFLNAFEQFRWTSSSTLKLTSNIVLDLMEDEDNRLWIGTDGGGLNCMDLKTNEIRTFQHQEKNPASLSGNVICAIQDDDHNHLWTGNFATGLNYMDKTTGHSQYFMPGDINTNSLGNENVWHILKDRKKNLWLATLGGGLSRLNASTRKFKNYTHKKNDSTSIVSDLVNCLSFDFKDNIWIATDEGLSVFNPLTEQFRTIPLIKPGTNTDFIEVHCNFTDRDGMIWAGTSWGGVFKIDPVTFHTSFFDFSNGQLINSVMSIIEDDYNQLWVGTSNGLGCMNKTSGMITFYDERDGLPSSMMAQTSCVKLKSGKMAFGSNEGFFIFDPLKLKSYPYPPILLISDLKINNKSVLVGDTINGHVILKKPIYETRQITLTYLEHEWTIGFSLLQFVNQRKVKVQYKLKGYNDDWRTADMNNRSITYTYLPQGEYEFIIKAENGYGIWCAPITLKVIIKPPFWNTTWFISLGIIFILGVFALGGYIRTHQLTSRKKFLESEVKKRTQELAEVNILLEKKTEDILHQNEELFTLNLTLENQKEAIQKQNEELVDHRQKLETTVAERTRELQSALTKALESERLKSAFLANMSHEIRTPMNAILGFSGLLGDKLNSPEKVKNYIEIIQSSGKTLMVLIDDIIDFSKIEAEILEFFDGEFDIGEVFTELHRYFTLENTNPNIDIQLNNHCRKNGMIISDRVRTYQIFNNLIVNALKFTKRGQITIGCNLNEDGDIVAFVRDTGIGIPADKFEYIFQPFNKIEDNNLQLYRGAGLGLTISMHLAQKMGYRIWVESEHGVGSVFYVKIPKEKLISLSSGN